MMKNLAKLLMTVVLAGVLAAICTPAAALEIEPADSGHYSVGLERTGVIVIAWPEQPSGRPAGAIVSWYTYEPDGAAQVWLLSDVIEADDEWVVVQICAGAFPGLFAECDATGGEMRLRKRDGRLRLDYSLPMFGGPECDPRPKVSPQAPVCQGTLRLERLTPPIL